MGRGNSYHGVRREGVLKETDRKGGWWELGKKKIKINKTNKLRLNCLIDLND